MPSKTPKQRRFMAGCANNPDKMGEKCPPPEVAKEFAQADARKNQRRRSKSTSKGK